MNKQDVLIAFNELYSHLKEKDPEFLESCGDRIYVAVLEEFYDPFLTENYSFQYDDYQRESDDKDIWLTVKVKNTKTHDECLIMFSGRYSSWSGNEWQNEFKIVQLKKRIIEEEYFEVIE